MSEKLWQQQIELWQIQDKTNDLNAKRIDELTKLVGALSDTLRAVIQPTNVTVENTCNGKKCRCGKVAH